MGCRIFCIVYLISILPGLDGEILPSFVWDPRNIRFNNATCPNGNIMHARYGDTLYLLCPNKYLNNDIIQHADPISKMHYNMYITNDEDDYRNCNSTNAQLLYGCSPNSPQGERLIDYKALFFRMASGSSSIMLDQGKTYYVFSTSDGTKAGLNNRVGGKCESHNMKLEIHFCKLDQECRVTHHLCNSVEAAARYFYADSADMFSNVYEIVIVVVVALLSVTFGCLCRSAPILCRKPKQTKANKIYDRQASSTSSTSSEEMKKLPV